jgi:phosphate transport system permease protein
MTAVAMPVTSPIDLSGSRRRQRKERSVRGVLFVMAALSLVITALIIFTLFRKAFGFLGDIGWDLGRLSDIGWFPRRELFDVSTLVVGSLIVTLSAMLVALPVGLGSAIYLSEYATPGFRKVVKPIIEVLAGIPSVVLGYFALTFIGPSIVQNLFNTNSQTSLLAAGVGVGILTIPLVASVSEDAMRAVPRSLREASYAVGSRKATTVMRVVLPAAISGLVAAFILAFSRALGETMVVAMAAGGNGLFTLDPLAGGKTMTGAMAELAKGTDQVATAAAVNSLYLVGAILFLLTLGLNVIANRIVLRIRNVY